MNFTIGQLYPFTRLYCDDLQKLILCLSVIGGPCYKSDSYYLSDIDFFYTGILLCDENGQSQ
jgi:hypothetical protein